MLKLKKALQLRVIVGYIQASERVNPCNYRELHVATVNWVLFRLNWGLFRDCGQYFELVGWGGGAKCTSKWQRCYLVGGSGGLLLYVHVFLPEVSRGPLLQCLFTISCFKEFIEAPTPLPTPPPPPPSADQILTWLEHYRTPPDAEPVQLPSWLLFH